MPLNYSKIMQLEKGHHKPQKKCSVIIDKKMHDKIRHLAYQNKTNHKEIIRKAVELYEKATIFDNLI